MSGVWKGITILMIWASFGLIGAMIAIHADNEFVGFIFFPCIAAVLGTMVVTHAK